MKVFSLVNLAMLLAVLGWCAISYGVISNMGDPAPWVSSDELRVRKLVGMIAISSGFIAIISALWLAGRGFKAACFRASLTLGICAAPLVVLAGYLYLV